MMDPRMVVIRQGHAGLRPVSKGFGDLESGRYINRRYKCRTPCSLLGIRPRGRTPRLLRVVLLLVSGFRVSRTDDRGAADA